MPLLADRNTPYPRKWLQNGFKSHICRVELLRISTRHNAATNTIHLIVSTRTDKPTFRRAKHFIQKETTQQVKGHFVKWQRQYSYSAGLSAIEQHGYRNHYHVLQNKPLANLTIPGIPHIQPDVLRIKT